MTTPVEEKTHAELGPSGWHTWGNCPGSIALSQGMPNTSSKYAREGTAAHALLEDCLEGGFDAEDLLGKTYVVEGEAFTVDMEMADAVNSAIQIVKQHIDTDAGDILMVEQSVPIAHLTGETGAVGTTDVSGIINGGKTLIILDYKHGKGVQVYASDKDGKPNGQLAMYALGTYHTLSALYEDIETVVLGVMQPRIDWFDSFELPLSDLLAFADEIAEAAGKVELNRQCHAEGTQLDLVPGEKQCKFCKAKAICPALKQYVGGALATVADPAKLDDFDDLTLPKRAAAVQVNEGVSGEKLAEFMRAIPLIETAIKAAQAEVERRLFAGETVPGFYLGVGRKPARKWKDEEQAADELTKSGRLKVSEAYKRKPISPTDAEKLFKGRPRIWAQLAPLIEQGDGKPSVCREGVDKNPVYALPSPDDFEDLTATGLAELASGLTVEEATAPNAILADLTFKPVEEIDPFS